MKYLTQICLVSLLTTIGIAKTAHAGLIDFGVAEKYTLAVGQYDWYGTPVGGNLILGSEALIYGNVAASSYIQFGAGTHIFGDACTSTASSVNPPVDGIYSACSDVIASDGNLFDQLSIDIASANQQAQNLGGEVREAITSTTTIDASLYDVLQINGLQLASNQVLTITGSFNDFIVINLTGNAFVGSGASILLEGGLTSANVVFNFVNAFDPNGQTTFNFGGANISGTFLANNGQFIAGDGATLNDVRFYTNNILQANVQTVKTQYPITQVPEPTTLMLWLGSLLLLFMQTKRKYQ